MADTQRSLSEVLKKYQPGMRYREILESAFDYTVRPFSQCLKSFATKSQETDLRKSSSLTRTAETLLCLTTSASASAITRKITLLCGRAHISLKTLHPKRSLT